MTDLDKTKTKEVKINVEGIKKAKNDLAEKTLPTVIGSVLEKRGKFGVSLILTSLSSCALAMHIAPDLLDDVLPLIEKYAIKESK